MIQRFSSCIKSMRRSCATYLLLFVGWSAFAQQQTITGTVRSSEDNSPLPGVSVSVPGTTQGTITNVEGSYSIMLASDVEELSFSFIGFKTQVVPIGSRTTIDITLEVDHLELEEVVVTALGVEKQTRSLGYSVTEFEGDNMVKARESNPVSTLTGKVAGLNVRTPTDFFQNPEITMRGGTPLVVIDGIPNPNADFWEISADDIENISVLKGATAAALYGSIGRNGALMITTKRGKNKLQIEFNSSTQFQSGFLRVPETQTVYGGGNGDQYEYLGPDNDNGIWVWGTRLDQPDPNTASGFVETVQIDSPIDPNTGQRIPTPWVSQGRDNMKNFFRTGMIQTNNISIMGGNDQGSIRASVSNSYQRGQVPNTDLNIIGMTVSGNYNLSDKISVDASLTYGRQESDNYPKLAYGSQSYLYTIMWMPPNIDIRDLRDYWVDGQEGYQQKQWNSQWFNNPWFTAYEYNQGWYRNSSYGQVGLNYKITSDLNFKVRSGFSYYYAISTEKEPLSWLRDFEAVSLGNYFITNESNSNMNTDAVFTYTKEVTPNLGITANVGGAVRTAQYLKSGLYTDGLNVPNYYNMANSRAAVVGENREAEELVSSVYATVDFEIMQSIFLGVTGRNDWVSTLPVENNSFFYPSVSASVVVSDLIEMPDPIAFLKVRSSWSQVSDGFIPDGNNLGNQPYNHIVAYNEGASWNNVNSVNFPGTRINPNLKPQTSNTWEVGLDARFLEGRLGIDVAYYNILDFNNLIAVPVSEASGFSSRLENGAEFRRKGIEILLTATPVKTGDFRWDISTNWSQYRRTLEKAFDDSGQLNNIKEGHRTDEIWTNVFQKTPGGQYIMQNGERIADPFVRMIGYNDADWVYGVQMNFRYKDFSLGISGDGRLGGKIYSSSNFEMHWAGTHPNTVRPERDDALAGISSFIDPGVEVVSGSVSYDNDGNILEDSRVYAPNTVKKNYISWAQNVYGKGETEEDFYYDESFFKLREVILSYNFPSNLLDNIFIQEASVSFVARNVLLITGIPQIDPDQGYDDQFQSPSTRSLGFNINFKF